nr:MAG TPA: hypothetical protein [Caudoviricetes sp.]
MQTNPPLIPQELRDVPGPKLVSANGTVERLVVVLEKGEDLKAATERVLEDGNVPALMTADGLMTWSAGGYIGFTFNSNTKLGVHVGVFDGQGKLRITKYIATIATE